MDQGRVRRVGGAGGGRAWLPGSDQRSRARRRRGRVAVPAGHLQQGEPGRRSAGGRGARRQPGLRAGGGRMTSETTRTVDVPALSLVVLIGASGSGKSTFAARHFARTEVISSDFCRGLVADDENDQSASRD